MSNTAANTSVIVLAALLFGCSGRKHLPSSSEEVEKSSENQKEVNVVQIERPGVIGGRECKNTIQSSKPGKDGNALRIVRDEKKAGEYRRVDEVTIVTDGTISVELYNPYYNSIVVTESEDYLAIVVEGVNDQWGLGVGPCCLSDGCSLLPGKSVMMNLDVRNGGNLRHPKAREASKSIQPGCYKARLANGPEIMQVVFELCIKEKED